ncbi:hypothetical protein GCM10023075_74010 [Streptosporangium album]
MAGTALTCGSTARAAARLGRVIRYIEIGCGFWAYVGWTPISSSAPAEGLRQLGEIPDISALPDGGGVEEEG